MVDEKIKDVFKELQGASLFREHLKSSKTILGGFKIENYENFNDMMLNLIKHTCNEAITDCSLDLKKPYCLMNTNSGYSPYLTLKQEIRTLLNLECYRDFFEEAFKQQKSQTKNQIKEPK